MIYKQDFESTRKYWDAFWAHELLDRPCTLVFAKNGEKEYYPPRLQAVDDPFDEMLRSAIS